MPCKTLCAFLVLLAVLILVAVACAPASAPTTAPTTAPLAATATSAPKPTTAPTSAPTVPAATAAPTTFIFGGEGEPVCLDPAIMSDGISGRVTSQIFEGLVKYEKDTTKVIPSLAQKWETSADGKVWTFSLQKGVKFQDGTDFDATAVVKNWDYWANPKNALHDAQIKAGKKFLHYPVEFRGFGDDSIIAKVEAVDSSTVSFTLKDVQGPFLQNLGIFSYVFWSPTALEKAGTDSCKSPVGTGPFKFVEWKPNEYVTLTKFDGYWDKPNAAKVDRVVIRDIKDNSARLAALKAGEIHGMEGLNPDDVKTVQADPNLQIVLRPSNNVGYLAFNYKVKEFQDPKVRQAIAQAINKKAIVDKLYGGTGLVANQMEPPSLWGYNKELKDWSYDPEAARKLLADAGYPKGLSEITWIDGKTEPFAFWYMPVARPYYPNPKEIAEAMAADLAKVGIAANLQTVDWAVYVDKRAKGELPFYMLGWTGNNGDPDDFVCTFFCSGAQDAPKSAEGFIVDKEISDLLKKAGALTNQSERAPMYQKAEQMIHDRVLRVFIANTQPPLALSKKASGYIANPTSIEFFNTVSIAK